MEREALIGYCLAQPGAEETDPFGEGELVAKVGGKAFAFIGLGPDAESVTFTCGRTEEEAALWRDLYRRYRSSRLADFRMRSRCRRISAGTAEIRFA